MNGSNSRPIGNDVHSCDAKAKNGRPICDVDGALARLRGDRSLLIELVRIYVEDAPMLLVRIHDGIRDDNCSDVLHAAHLLHGLAANFGARNVTEPAERLEEIAVDGRLTEAAPLLERLEAEAVRLEKELAHFR